METISVISVLIGALLALCCSVGMFVGDAFDRLHYLGPPTLVTPILIGIGIVLKHDSIESIVKVTIIILLLALASPILTHATAESGCARRLMQGREESN